MHTVCVSGMVALIFVPQPASSMIVLVITQNAYLPPALALVENRRALEVRSFSELLQKRS